MWGQWKTTVGERRRAWPPLGLALRTNEKRAKAEPVYKAASSDRGLIGTAYGPKRGYDSAHARVAILLGAADQFG